MIEVAVRSYLTHKGIAHEHIMFRTTLETDAYWQEHNAYAAADRVTSTIWLSPAIVSSILKSLYTPGKTLLPYDRFTILHECGHLSPDRSTIFSGDAQMWPLYAIISQLVSIGSFCVAYSMADAKTYGLLGKKISYAAGTLAQAFSVYCITKGIYSQNLSTASSGYQELMQEFNEEQRADLYAIMHLSRDELEEFDTLYREAQDDRSVEEFLSRTHPTMHERCAAMQDIIRYKPYLPNETISP